MASQIDHSTFTTFPLPTSTKTMMTMMLIMMILLSVVKGNNNVVWRTTVATGNATDAGTNGTIYVTFKGTANSSNVHLTSLNGVLFQRAQVDVFTIHTDYIGQLVELAIIHVEFSSSNTYLKWQLDYLLLLNVNTSTEYGFQYDNYIPENSNHYGEATLQPDTIRQLTNRTTVSSSSLDSSVFPTQSLLAIDSSPVYSNDLSSVFSEVDTSVFDSGTVGPTPTVHTVVSGFQFTSVLTPDPSLLATASIPTSDPKTSSSLLHPTSEISFTLDTGLATADLLDATIDTLAAIIDSKSRFSEIPILGSNRIHSSCACLTTEMAPASGDLQSRMASVSRELTVDKKQLSAYKRKKSSAADDRNSAKAIGFVSLLVLVLPVAYVILVDLSNYRRYLPSKERKKISRKQKRIENV